MYIYKKMLRAAADKNIDIFVEMLAQHMDKIDRDFLFEMDKGVFGDHMCFEVAEHAVHKMVHDNGEVGEKFSRDKVVDILVANDIPEECHADYYFVMNMLYSDYCLLIGEGIERYVPYTGKFIQDVDGPKDKVKRYYYKVMCSK